MSEVETGKPIEPKKYQTYSCKVDPNQDDRATEIKIFSFARPHMRAFHCSWWSFHVAFFIWFAVAPLLVDIRKTFGVSKTDIWTTSICSVAGTIFMRFINGPVCDKYGARIPMGAILIFASIPCACTGLARNILALALIRFCIGLGGSTFVMCQYWTTRMFTKEVAGTANAMVGGWGNLGGGVTQLVMGSVLFPLFKTGMDTETAWRTVSIVPAVVGVVTGITILMISDDAPKGNYNEMKKNGIMPAVSASASFRQGALDFNTWILFVQYACCFGVELTMNNAAATYFQDQFGQTTESAAAIASIFGWMNLFARGIGGYVSDKVNAKMGMRGRLYWQSVLLLLEGIMVFLFAITKNLGLAIFIMVLFSTFVQAAEGSTYGIVPYVNPPATGSIAGIVGAGGNVGAVCFGLGFRQMKEIKYAFFIMGGVILFSSILSVAINIKGHAGMFHGQDSETVRDAWMGKTTGEATTLEVPVKEVDKDDEEDA